MQAVRRGSRLANALLRQAGADTPAALQLRQPSQAVQRRLASPQGTGMHGEGTSRGQAGDKNIWEAPTEPRRWKENQRAFAVLGVAGVGCYALLSGWLRAKQADLPEMKKEAKTDAPPAATPTDRRSPQVSDAVSAAFPMKESLRATSNAPTASPKLSEDRRHGEPFNSETGVQGRKDNPE